MSEKRTAPKKSGKSLRKQRYNNYLTCSTCGVCKLVFRSPNKRLAHIASGHKDMTGVNKNRQPRTAGLTFG